MEYHWAGISKSFRFEMNYVLFSWSLGGLHDFLEQDGLYLEVAKVINMAWRENLLRGSSFSSASKYVEQTKGWQLKEESVPTGSSGSPFRNTYIRFFSMVT